MNDDAAQQPDAGAPHRRIAHLEAELAFQGDTLRELNEALAAQQLDLITLQRQVTLLGEQLAALRRQVGPATDDVADARPPHY